MKDYKSTAYTEGNVNKLNIDHKNRREGIIIKEKIHCGIVGLTVKFKNLESGIQQRIPQGEMYGEYLRTGTILVMDRF